MRSFCEGLIFVLGLCVFAPALQAQDCREPNGPAAAGLLPAPGHRFRIDVFTMAPGAEIYSTWGHTALHVYDSRTGVDVVFDYGIFDFGPDFIVKFLQGKPAFLVYPFCTQRTLMLYGSNNRRIYAQQLLLNDQQAEALFLRLQINSLPQNRVFLYHHYKDNCTTRIRDQLQRVDGIDLQTQFSGKIQADSFRTSSMHMMEHRPTLWLATNLILGPNVDRPVDQWQNQYLPLQFMNALDTFRNAGHQDLVGPVVTVQKGRANYREGVYSAWIVWLLLYVIIFSVLYIYPIIKPDQRFAKLFGRIGWLSWHMGAGLVGFVLSVVWFGTDHDSTFNNLNLLGYAPLLWLVAILSIIWRRQAKWDIILQLHQFWIALPLLGLLLNIMGVSSQFSWPFLLNATLIQALLWYRLKRAHGT